MLYWDQRCGERNVSTLGYTVGRLVQLVLINPDVADYQIANVPEGFGHRPAQNADGYQLRVIECGSGHRLP